MLRVSCCMHAIIVVDTQFLYLSMRDVRLPVVQGNDTSDVTRHSTCIAQACSSWICLYVVFASLHCTLFYSSYCMQLYTQGFNAMFAYAGCWCPHW